MSFLRTQLYSKPNSHECLSPLRCLSKIRYTFVFILHAYFSVTVKLISDTQNATNVQLLIYFVLVIAAEPFHCFQISVTSQSNHEEAVAGNEFSVAIGTCRFSCKFISCTAMLNEMYVNTMQKFQSRVPQ